MSYSSVEILPMINVFELVVVRMAWRWDWTLHRIFDVKSVRRLALLDLGVAPRDSHRARDLGNCLCNVLCPFSQVLSDRIVSSAKQPVCEADLLKKSLQFWSSSAAILP